jgi:mono/diheme cytochrome c family protein
MPRFLSGPALAGLLLTGAAPPGLAAEEAALALGREVFTERAEPRCALCHTLADTGAAGDVGPNLDEMAPEAARIRAAVASGVGVMPPYAETLTPEEIDAVAAYVAAAAAK